MGVRNHHGCKYRGFISAASIPMWRAPTPIIHPTGAGSSLPAPTPLPRLPRSPPIIPPSPTHLEVAAVCPDASCRLEHLLVHDQPVIHIQTRGSRLAHNCRGLHRICWTRRLARDGGGQLGRSSNCLAQHQGCGRYGLLPHCWLRQVTAQWLVQLAPQLIHLQSACR